MAKLVCPECEATFKPKNPPPPGKKTRCPECQHAFVPDTDDDDAEETSPRNKKKNGDGKSTGKSAKKKKNKKSGSTTLVLLLVGGGAFLLLGCGCAGGLGWFFFGRDAGSGGGILAKAPDTSEKKWKELSFGMTVPEVDAFLGGTGKKADLVAVNALIDRTAGMLGRDKARPVGDSFVIYRNGNTYIVAGFVNSQKYGSLSDYYAHIVDAGGNGNSFGQMSIGGANLEKGRDADEALKTFLNDPKWAKGPEVRKRLIGTWQNKIGGFEFKADGTMAAFIFFGKTRRDVPGTYEFIDDHDIKTITKGLPGLGGADFAVTRRILLNGNELTVVDKLGETNKYLSKSKQTYTRAK
jgi:hypothetical protein